MRRLALVSLLGATSFTFLLASVPLWVVQHGSASAVAGLPTTVMLLSTVATQGLVPAAAARFGTGRLLAAGVLALGVPAPLYAISGSFAVLLPVSVVRGFGFAALTVLGSALTATLAPPERHGESVGVYGLSTALPSLLGVPLGVALTQAHAFGWVTAIGALAVLGVPAALGLNPGRGELPGDDADLAPVQRRALVAVILPSAILFVVTFAGGGLTTFLPVARRTGQLATIALFVFAAGTVLGRWRVGRLADRFGAIRLLPATLVVGAAGLLTVSGGLLGNSGVAVIVGAGLFGVGYGAVQNLTVVIAFARAGPRRVAGASAVWNASYDAGTALGAVVVGAVAATGVGLPRSFGLSGLLVAATLLLLARRRPAKPALVG
jgi:predicted MFS family arabinose efflux permease